jgi:SpoU rRNA methylase family enzyme
MKARFAIAISIVLVAGALARAGEGSWIGYITDSKCGAKAAHEGAEECTAKCVKEGATLVFVNDTDKKVYAISDQDKVAAHAGHHVAVKGSVEGNTLTVASIDMTPSKGKQP